MLVSLILQALKHILNLTHDQFHLIYLHSTGAQGWDNGKVEGRRVVSEPILNIEYIAENILFGPHVYTYLFYLLIYF